jgi:serine/threonine protein kinase
MGIVHRDVKPANLFLGSDGHIALGDYGICKRFAANMKVCLLSTLSINEFIYSCTKARNVGAMWTSAWQAVLCLKEVKVQEGFQVPEI